MTNAEVVQAAYAAFAKGDVPGMLTYIDGDVKWEFSGPADIPWSGSFRGHDGVMQFFSSLTDEMDFLQFQPYAFVSDGNRVIVLGREILRHKQTGQELPTEWAQAFTVVNEKITAFREYTDTAATAAVFNR